MTVTASIAAVMARIATISEPPAAVRVLDDRFNVQAAAALTSATAPAGIAAARRVARLDLTGASATGGTAMPSGKWVDRIPNARGRALVPEIQAAADRTGMDPAFLAAVFWTESSYTPDAVSRTGAIGLGQLMPETAEWLGVNPWDPVQNIDGSARLYRHFLDQNHGDIRLAIASYAAGPGAVKRAGGVPDDFTRHYIDLLLARTDYLAGRRSTPP